MSVNGVPKIRRATGSAAIQAAAAATPASAPRMAEGYCLGLLQVVRFREG
jgi:hypothetical protein